MDRRIAPLQRNPSGRGQALTSWPEGGWQMSEELWETWTCQPPRHVLLWEWLWVSALQSLTEEWPQLAPERPQTVSPDRLSCGISTVKHQTIFWQQALVVMARTPDPSQSIWFLSLYLSLLLSFLLPLSASLGTCSHWTEVSTWSYFIRH